MAVDSGYDGSLGDFGAVGGASDADSGGLSSAHPDLSAVALGLDGLGGLTTDDDGAYGESGVMARSAADGGTLPARRHASGRVDMEASIASLVSDDLETVAAAAAAAVVADAADGEDGSRADAAPSTPGGSFSVERTNSTASRSAARGSPDKGRLAARLPAAVEGCTLVPFVSARTDTGTQLRPQDERISFKWTRSEECAACAFAACPFAGDAGTTATLRVVGFPSASGGRGRFCSMQCLKSAWPSLVPVGDEADAKPDSAAAASAAASSPSLSASGAARGGTTSMSVVRDLFSASSGLESLDKGLADMLRRTAGSGGDLADLSASERAFAVAELASTVHWDPAAEAEAAGVLAVSREYTPTAADVLHRLCCEVRVGASDAGGAEMVRLAVSAPVMPFPTPPPKRVWRPLLTDGPSKLPRPHSPQVAEEGDRAAPKAIRVLSYNVLAEIYATGMVYPYCPGWALNSSYRQRLVLRELMEADADIICLQEVQKDHFESTFNPELSKMGYVGLYKQKNRLAMGVEGKVDGCATFYRASRFDLVRKNVLDFNEAVKQCFEGEAAKADGMPPADAASFLNHIRGQQRRLMHDNIAQVLVLRMLTTPQGARLREPCNFCVANTHLFWDPEFTDVKLWQTHMLLRELEKSITIPLQYPLVLCGDFNSEPSSAVYALLAGNYKSGRRIALPPAQLPPDPLHVLSQGGTHLSHSIFLASAYGEVLGAEPSYTNVTQTYVGCLDYIWCTANDITPLAVKAIPSREELGGPWKTALPNPQHPSDHLPLVADLLLDQQYLPPTMVPLVAAARGPHASSSAFGSGGGARVGGGASGMIGGPALPVPSSEMGGMPAHIGLGSHMHQARPGQRASAGAGGSGVGGLGGLGLGGPGVMGGDGMWFSQPGRQAGGAGGAGGIDLAGGQFGIGLSGLGSSPQRMGSGRNGAMGGSRGHSSMM